MRLFARHSSPSRNTKVYIRDKENKPITGFHVPRNDDISQESLARFKAEYAEYFASNEHVTNGPFHLYFGSFIRHEDNHESN